MFVTATEIPLSVEALERVDIVAVIEARTAIEVEAAALAAERHTVVELKLLREALNERETHRGDVDQHVATDTAFHRSIIVAAHSPILLDLFDSFAPRSRHAMADMLRLRGRYGDDADHGIHERIYEAIASRDTTAAGGLTRAHLCALKELLG